MPHHLWHGNWRGKIPDGDVHQRARTIIRPTGGIVRGKFPSRKNGRMVHHEGLLELDAIYLFEASPLIARFREQPITIQYPDGTRLRRYTPDFELVLATGEIVLVEIKPARRLASTDKGPPLRRPGKIRELEDISIAAELVAGTAKLLADWPSSFWSCIESFVDVAPADASIRRVFGSLYHVLYQDLRDPSFQFLRDAFELFLLEHWRGELCGRHRLFSEVTIKNHRHQGLARVARAAGMSSKRLRKMIHQDRFPANQFNPDSARNIITVDKDLLARLVPSPTEYLDL